MPATRTDALPSPTGRRRSLMLVLVAALIAASLPGGVRCSPGGRGADGSTVEP